MPSFKFLQYLLFLFASMILVSCSENLPPNGSSNQDNDVGSQYSLKVVHLSDEAKIATPEVPLSVTVALMDHAGKSVKGVVLQFSAKHAHFNTTDGMVMTDESGNATISIFPQEGYQGADYLSVKYLNPNDYNSEMPSALAELQVAYIINQTTKAVHAVLMDDIQVNPSLGALSYGGTASLKVDFYLDANDSGKIDSGDPLYTSPIEVHLSSLCASENKSKIDGSDTPLLANQGTATSIYKAISCEGEDLVTAVADLNGQTLTSQTKINVLPASVGSIVFTRAEPQTIYLKGSGGVESSRVSYKVLNEFGLPKSNVKVRFKLNTRLGGIELKQSESITNSEGIVSAQVVSGNIPTPIGITATVLDKDDQETNLQTTSYGLVVAVGYADQQHFSLSADTLNPEAWSVSNATVNVTASLSDRNGNPVMDGTVVYFMAESGQIESTCRTISGQCAVKWHSQNEQNKPGDHRATILAYALGGETFYDKDGNGVMNTDDGEPWDNKTSSGFRSIFVNRTGNDKRVLTTLNKVLDEPFRDENKNGIFDEPYKDANGNGVYDLGEAFVDYNKNGRYDGNNVPGGESLFIDINGNGYYDGSGLVFPEPYTDLNLNGQYDYGEPFSDRTDLYGYRPGIYDSGYITLNGKDDYTGLEDFTNLNNSTDDNGNPTFDLLGSSDMSEPWLDLNEDGIRSADEPFVDYDENGAFTARNSKYDGLTCKKDDSICSGELTYVRRSLALVLASSEPLYEIRYLSGDNVAADGTCSPGDLVITNSSSGSLCALPTINKGGKVSLKLFISDTAGQSLPFNTDITAESMLWTKIAGLNHFIVGNSNAEGMQVLPFSITNDPSQFDLQNPFSDTITIKVKTPHNVETDIPLAVRYSQN